MLFRSKICQKTPKSAKMLGFWENFQRFFHKLNQKWVFADFLPSKRTKNIPNRENGRQMSIERPYKPLPDIFEDAWGFSTKFWKNIFFEKNVAYKSTQKSFFARKAHFWLILRPFQPILADILAGEETLAKSRNSKKNVFWTFFCGLFKPKLVDIFSSNLKSTTFATNKTRF